MIKFSASNNSFYDAELQYSDMPADAIDIDDQAWSEIMRARENGQMISHDENGHPKILPPQPDVFYKYSDKLGNWVIDTKLEAAHQDALKNNKLVAAQSEYKRLMQIADTDLAPLNDAVDLEIATDQEIARQKELKKYRVYLSRVPTQMDYPDLIAWPEYPL